jgi:integrase
MRQKINLTTVNDPAIVAAAGQAARDQFVWDTGDASVKGFGLKVTPAGQRSYVLQYRMGGRGTPTKRYRLGDVAEFKSPDEARRKAARLVQGVRDGKDPMLSRKQGQTVQQLVKAYIADFEDGGRRDAGESGRILNRIVVPAWGTRPVSSIAKSDVNRLVDGIKGRGAPVMANRTLAAIQRLFKFAVAKDYLEKSPAVSIAAPAQEESRDRTLSDAELVEVWNAACAIGWPFGPAVQLMILSGQRREECGGMGKAEIDRAKGLWSLPPERTKNGLPHDVHLTPQMLAVLDGLPNVSKRLYFTTTGETPVSGWSRAKDQLDVAIVLARQDRAGLAGDGTLQLTMRKEGEARIAAKGDVAPFSDRDRGRMMGVKLAGEWSYVRLTEIFSDREAEARIVDGAAEGGETSIWLPGIDPWRIHDLRRSMATKLNELGVLEKVADILINHRARKKGGVAAVYNRYLYMPERKAALELWCRHFDALLSGVVPASNVVHLAPKA